ncbi:MAG: hypothetical protein Unbinned5081contig1003_31 [Prokaryotic dsDNA virus sp.]|nr:MAG: hypothetical protein Unbinned5081contig1003_31 [Prokaryotic dsDNA virus sp.]|tara:strand:- start:114 stop:461 length:348 start_codon:yes stop_codon:yes gene_type:complete
MRVIEGFENYGVKKNGEVFKVSTGEKVLPRMGVNGNIIVYLYSENKKTTRTVASLVLNTWANRKLKVTETTKYLDCDPWNCSLDNLKVVKRKNGEKKCITTHDCWMNGNTELFCA